MINLSRASAAERDAFIAIYEEALPPSERKSREAILALEARPDFRVMLCLRGGAVIGFAIVYIPQDEDFALLEYIAVGAGGRGAGIGSRIFAEVLEAVGERVLVIEIDSDLEDSADRETRTRRRRFYEREGAARIAGLAYRMPPVGEGTPPAMDLLVHPRGRPFALSPARAAHWIRSIYRDVYGVEVAEGDLDAMLRAMPAAA